MTVNELIEKLSKWDGKLHVYIDGEKAETAEFNGDEDVFEIRSAPPEFEAKLYVPTGFESQGLTSSIQIDSRPPGVYSGEHQA